VRGEGLLLGLLAVCPNGELVEALRAERLLAAAAGDNVVRMLPPLIIDEPEIAEAIHRIDSAAARIEFNQRERVAAGAKP
jgi:acetylornithine/N-succinyldiaminopimelate aminotransferase